MAETSRITFSIDSDTDDALTAIAEATGRDKTGLAREALIEWLEDQIDIRDAKAILAKGEPTIPLEEVKRMLELDEDATVLRP